MLTILVLILAITLYCYKVAFYVPPRKPLPEDFIDVPPGAVYEPFHPQMRAWALENKKRKQEHFSIKSFDGLTLWGTYYEYAPGAPVELMFHGYRGNAQRDLPGGVQRCFACGRSAFVVDQRCSGRSEGRTITFGVNERKDCLKWVDFLVEHFGPQVKIILTGISMGAATVVMAGGEALPPNVIGILADCGYSSQKEIQLKVAKEMGFPAKLCYPFIRLAARVFGGFDLEETTPLEALKRVKVPVIFFHGQADGFVPCHMSRAMYEACPGKKDIYTVPGADHGLAYPVDMDGYVARLREFFGPDASAD
jgi:pimeloyl-ACP methyl ester carboxylesterase